ncbi:PHP domain-containing protein [Kordia periserrulae]|uniref:PHP domain-containing protein n=1 Tax=Kordia periserrulae TaxID=701523 RepID=A0A2T6BYD8_9FLAO|nr:AAA family ATPase [Kordia periserrulae]PTX61058.1 PHP domain-containing protein [Kordia periserrulae]
MVNRGSEWRKWDLHVHSPYTFLNKYSSTDEEFISKVKAKNISCLGLTNYFKFDTREYELKKKLEDEDIITFLNLELRLDYQNKDDECLDLHIIFSNKVCNEKIDRFLNNMTVNVQGVDKKLADLNSLNDFKKAVINFDSLLECLKTESIGLNGEFLIGFLSRGKGNARSSTNYEKITRNIDLLIHSTNNPKNVYEDREFWLEYKKPVLQNSDAHSLETIGNKFTWIKAHKSFEGLKQITYEPEERVKIQTEMPESEKLDQLMIEKVTFTSSNDRFTPDPIYFNKNLNVIIGGKSSGKSILLYEIAKTLYANTEDKVLKYRDIESNTEKDLYELEYLKEGQKDNDYSFCVHLYSGSSQKKDDREENSSILSSIKYIPQNHLSNLVDKSRKNGATLKKIIRNLILEEPRFKEKYDDFVEKAKANDRIRNQDIDYYFTLKDNLDSKEKELLGKGDTKALKEGIFHNKKKIEELNKDFTAEEQAKYTELTEKLSLLKIKENQINSDFEKLRNFQIELKRFLEEYSNKKRITIDTLQNDKIKDEYQSKLAFIDEALSSTSELAKELSKGEDEKYIQGSVFADLINDISTEIKQAEKDLEPLNAKFDNQKQVAALQKSIRESEEKITEIEQFLKEVEKNKKAVEEQKEKIFKDFKTNFELYDEIIKDLQPRITDINSEADKVEILPSIKYNFPKFRKLIDSLFDGRRFNNQGFEELYQYVDKNPKSALVDIDYIEIEKSLRILFEKINNGDLSPKGGNNKKDAIKKVFTDFFFDHWDVKSQGDDIHKMSTGKASFVLLKLIIKLSKDNGPILIDQPEDNLDNRSISKALVNFLKDKKKERQIILVTHNPNIVVNADAENIIVANQKGQNDVESTSSYTFDYINGALENSFPYNGSSDLLKSMGIREHIAEVVEGGKEAFKKREEKYGFM